MSVIKTLFTLAVLSLIAGGIFAWSGTYNIAANDKHWDITTKLIEIVRDRSINVRSKNISEPDITDAVRVERGARNYSDMCATCHLEPGKESSELYEGLYPKPPKLFKNSDFSYTPAEQFWIIKNGIKMTGMPAWGINNSDEQIWDMVALIGALDSMTLEQYEKFVESGEHAHKGDESHVAEKSHVKEDEHEESASNMQKSDAHAESSAEKPDHVDSGNDHTH